MQKIECPTCGKPMTVSVYYAAPEPSVGFDGDYEVTILDAECEHEFTEKQHEEVFEGLWDAQQEANAADHEDEPRYARGYDDL